MFPNISFYPGAVGKTRDADLSGDNLGRDPTLEKKTGSGSYKMLCFYICFKNNPDPTYDKSNYMSQFFGDIFIII